MTRDGDETATHWRQAGRDYGWPNAPVVVDLWAPHGREMPADWLERFCDHSCRDCGIAQVQRVVTQADGVRRALCDPCAAKAKAGP